MTGPYPPAEYTAYGIGVAFVGEDAEDAILFGHPGPLQTVAALQRALRWLTGERTLGYLSLAEALEQLRPDRKWARLCTKDDCEDDDCGTEEGAYTDYLGVEHPAWTHRCEMCAHLADGGWWLDYLHTEPTSRHAGWFPITYLRVMR